MKKCRWFGLPPGRVLFPAVAASLLGLACHTPNGRTEQAWAQLARPLDASVDRDANSASSPSATVRTVEVADVVRIEGDRLYLLNEPRGLVAFDISNIEHPHEIWHDAIDGIPVGLFVNKGIVLAAVTDWGGRGSSPVHGSLLRAIDVQSANAPFIRSEVSLRGEIRDIHAVDAVYYVLREDASNAPSSTVLSSFRVDDGGVIRQLNELPMLGASSSFAVSPTKIAVARRVSDAAGTVLTFVDIDRERSGTLIERGSLHLPGTLRIGPEPRIDAGGRFLWVVTCGSSDCGPGSTYALSSIDSIDTAAPREAGKLILPLTRGSLVAVFDGARLFLAESDGTSLEIRESSLYVVDLAHPDQPTLQRGAIRVRGAVSNMIPIGDRLLAIASGGIAATSTHVLVHTVELTPPGALRLLGSAAFGEDWTSIAPASVPKNIVDDAGGQWFGLPFSTWDEDRRRYATGIEVFRHAPHGFMSVGGVSANEWVGRVLFLRGRFIGVSASGLTVVDPSRMQTLDRTRAD